MTKQERIGVVISNKAEKTITVAIQIRYQHPKYGKILIKTKRYMAHDEENQCKQGQFQQRVGVIPVLMRPLHKPSEQILLVRWSETDVHGIQPHQNQDKGKDVNPSTIGQKCRAVITTLARGKYGCPQRIQDIYG
jgi:ribosomal protein S17